MEPVIADENEQAESDADNGEASEKTDGEESGARTPAQSRSPSVHPQEEEEADLFDGYSFKGRHSVLIEDEDDEHAEGDEDADEIDDEEDIQRLANADVGQAVEDEAQTADGTETEAEEPKTPEARKSGLPELTPAEEIAALHKAALAATEASEPSTPVREVAAPAPSGEEEKTPEGTAAKTEEEEAPQTPLTPQAAPRPRPSISESVAKATPTAPPASKILVAARSGRPRREKSGIPALDRYMSDGGDDEMTERDEDDDWDFVEALPIGAEDRNGAKGTSLFARGVVDRYKLSVFRKSATPSKSAGQRRNVSGLSLASDLTTATADVPSPTPAEKRRGRNPGLTFRRNPKQFLKTRSPPPSVLSNGSSRTHVQRQSSATALSSTASSTGNLLSPAPSTHPSTFAGPSLRSKDSTTSMGSPGSSDDQSLNGDVQNSSVDALGSGATSPDASKRNVTIDEPEKPKGKKLKKYKENAEKMLSIFASPR